MSTPHGSAWLAETPEQTLALLEQIRSGPPPAPDLHGLFYSGQLHTLIGESDAGKSLLMAAITTDLINNGQDVLWVDFEFQRRRNVQRMIEFGATDEALTRHLYRVNHPLGAPPPAALEQFRGVKLVVADACTGLLAASELGSNSDVDVDLAYTSALRPFCDAGAAVILIDHVVKDKENQSRYAVGSQRKLGAADASWRVKTIQTFKAGQGGRSKLTVNRDRDGALRAMEFVLLPDMSWRIEQSDAKSGDPEWLPTWMMQEISLYLERRDNTFDKATKNEIEKRTKGAVEYKRKALAALIEKGFVATESGPRGAIFCVSVKPYREPERATSSTSSDLVATSSAASSDPTSSPRLLVSLRDEDVDEVGECADGEEGTNSSSMYGRGAPS